MLGIFSFAVIILKHFLTLQKKNPCNITYLPSFGEFVTLEKKYLLGF